ncbi:50S ribosomal protein L10 [Coraliomargarita sinensis]|uniref:Large ribosomal subunit protein uL10 n=1 Tax=Coraliomargarita sinensis TaxID=2174842 RepID=A0A317ZF51_9BACT|nr:50S ribosomal protein L10 [Coraliomargarita sinensis]PXA03472.1 50S ribosomal protein L10 [Coraliomargarita sinensis]
MRPEKKYLVDEVSTHLAKSDYVYLANYERITVDETAELRASLAEHDAEFHVVKNTIFGIAAGEKEYPDVSEHLSGPTAIIVGGNNPSGVAKVLNKFFKDKEKVDLKVGIFNDKTLDKQQIEALAKLPGLESLRAQLLGLLTQPGTGLVRVLNAVPQNVVNVLQAKVRAENGE